MLHRGKYAIEEVDGSRARSESVSRFRRLIGMGSEFDFWDKVIYLSTIGWTVLWLIVFIGGTVYNLIFDVKSDAWITFWKYYIWVILGISAFTSVWFTIGGWRDFKKLFVLLAKIKRSELDDGTVVDCHNAGEETVDNKNI